MLALLKHSSTHQLIALCNRNLYSMHSAIWNSIYWNRGWSGFKALPALASPPIAPSEIESMFEMPPIWFSAMLSAVIYSSSGLPAVPLACNFTHPREVCPRIPVTLVPGDQVGCAILTPAVDRTGTFKTSSLRWRGDQLKTPGRFSQPGCEWAT